MEMKGQIDASPTRRQRSINYQVEKQKEQNADSTFVTRGSENTTIVCDNW